MSQDVIYDEYARLFELPTNLAASGVDVSCLCLSYRKKDQGLLKQAKNINWISINIFYWLAFGYLYHLIRLCKSKRPELIMASSDVLQITIGYWVSKVVGCFFIADLYDNYESFSLAKFPFLKRLYRQALSNADHVLTVSRPLEKKIRVLAEHDRVTTIESTIDKKYFFKKEKMDSRYALGIDIESSHILLGLCGALDTSRGIEYFYKGFELAKHEEPGLVLVLAGFLDDNNPPPKEGVEYLGRLKHKQMNDFFNAVDINAITMLPNEFGCYAFPQKAYEMAAAARPCIVPNFGAMGDLFTDCPAALYQPACPESIAQAILQQSRSAQLPGFDIPDWIKQGRKIKQIIEDLSGGVC